MSRISGYNASTALSKARRVANREKARRWYFEEGVKKDEIITRLGVSRCTVNLYLREERTIPKFNRKR